MQTPFVSCSGVSWLKLKLAPRNLNAPLLCRFSALKYSGFWFGRDRESVAELNMGVRCMMGLMVSRAAATAALVRGGAVCWLDSFIPSVDREFSENSAKVHTHVGRSHAGKRHSPSRDITSSLTMYAYGPVRCPPEISTS